MSTPDEYRKQLNDAVEAAEAADAVPPAQAPGGPAQPFNASNPWAAPAGQGGGDPSQGPAAPYGQALGGQPLPGQGPYGQAGYGQPQFGQPQYAPATYAQAGYAGSPYAPSYGFAFPVAQDATSPDDLTNPLRGAAWEQALSRFFKNYATFTGRASLSEYLWIALTNALVVLLGLGVILMIAAGSGAFETGGTPSPWIMVVPMLLMLYSLAVLVPSLALTWRRLHDANFSGALWCLSFIPYVGSLIVFILCCQAPNPSGARFDEPVRPLGY